VARPATEPVSSPAKASTDPPGQFADAARTATVMVTTVALSCPDTINGGDVTQRADSDPEARIRATYAPFGHLRKATDSYRPASVIFGSIPR
jgi:hypothetical protein